MDERKVRDKLELGYLAGRYGVRLSNADPATWDILKEILRKANQAGTIVLQSDLDRYPIAFTLGRLPGTTGRLTDLAVVQRWLVRELTAGITAAEVEVARLLARTPPSLA